MLTKKKYACFFVICTTGALILSACGGGPTSDQPEPSSEQSGTNASSALCLPGIEAGKTSRVEVVSQLGEPTLTTTDQQGYEVLEYPSSIEMFPTTVCIKDDIVQLVTRLSDDENQTVTKLKNDLGEPEQVTFSYFAQFSMTYLYPQKGIVAIVDEENDRVLWAQCFAPMPLSDYMAGWGSQLPLENPYIR